MSNTSCIFHSTAVAAVNQALVTLGQDVTLAPNELAVDSANVNGRKAAYLYESARLRVLRDHAWNFARREVGCHGYQAESRDRFVWAAMLPPKCIKLLMCYGDNGRPVEYRIVGKEIRSVRPVVHVAYTADVEDLSRWSPDAYGALVLRIASDLAKPVTGRTNERQLQEAAYQDALTTAKLHDSSDVRVDYDAYGENHYVEAMLRGRSGRRRDDCFRR